MLIIIIYPPLLLPRVCASNLQLINSLSNSASGRRVQIAPDIWSSSSEIWSDLEYDSCVPHFKETELAQAPLQSALSLCHKDIADVSLRGESGKMQFFTWL